MHGAFSTFEIRFNLCIFKAQSSVAIAFLLCDFFGAARV